MTKQEIFDDLKTILEEKADSVRVDGIKTRININTNLRNIGYFKHLENLIYDLSYDIEDEFNIILDINWNDIDTPQDLVEVIYDAISDREYQDV